MNIILNCRQERFRENIAFMSRIVVRKDTSRLVLYGVFPVPLGQFTSVTYPSRTGGKRLTFSLGPRDPKRFGYAAK